MNVTLQDGTSVMIDGTLDSSLPVVVLLHGLGGSIADMTAPLSNPLYSSIAFNRTATFPLLKDEGWHPWPPLLPVAGFFLDPPLTAVTSWRAALNAAGFTTITYMETSRPNGLVASSVTQLGALVTELLMGTTTMGAPDLTKFRVAFVGHSRGGVIIRSFLAGARTNPAFASFLPRVATAITLHSPNAGSGLAGLAVAVDTLLARLQAAFTSASLPAGTAFVASLRSLTANPTWAELAPGSPTLTGITPAEPVPGIMYHTFGGTSLDFLRLWASVYTPDSTIPFPLFPLFHWNSTPLVVGTPLNILSFAPPAILAPLPVITEIMAALAALVATTPELAPGAGDLLVSDARSRLPFETSHTTNPSNHLEALWDPRLQAQVIAILLRLRNPLVSGIAIATLSPYPATTLSRQYTVKAADAVTGMVLNAGTVAVRDTYGKVVLTKAQGIPFTYAFKGRRVRTDDDVEMVFPTVEVRLGPPYGTVEVDTGLA